jgi:hypothetical protein
MCPLTDIGVVEGVDAAIGADAVIGADAAAVGAGAADVGAVAGAGADLGAVAGAADAGAAAGAGAIPEVLVSAPATAGAGGAGAIGGAIGALPGLALGAGPTGSVATPDASGNPSTDATAGPQALLPGVPGASALDPNLASALGIDFNVPGADATIDASPLTFGSANPADLSGVPGLQPTDILASGPAAAPDSGGAGSSIASWLSHPKNAITASMLGLSGIQAFSKPALPSGASQALGSAGASVSQAQQVLAAGGMGGPTWALQKQSIDAGMAQRERQLIQSIQQNAATSGGGGADSGLVQQQIAQARAQLEVEREQAYAQAASQNVAAAVAELTGGNQTLTSVAQMQLAQQNASRQQATQLAQLAALLNQSSFPGG